MDTVRRNSVRARTSRPTKESRARRDRLLRGSIVDSKKKPAPSPPPPPQIGKGDQRRTNEGALGKGKTAVEHLFQPSPSGDGKEDPEVFADGSVPSKG